MGCEGCGVTLPLKRRRKRLRELIAAQQLLIDAGWLPRPQPMTEEQRAYQLELIVALRRHTPPRTKGGRPRTYSDADVDALIEFLDDACWPREFQRKYDAWRRGRPNYPIARIEFLLLMTGRDSGRADDWQQAIRRRRRLLRSTPRTPTQ